MAFLESDLNISQREIDDIKAALANSGIANAFTNTITEQVAKVEDYTLRYQISEDRQKRLARSLILHRLYSLLGPVPENHVKAYEDAMDELVDIRDGKFPDLAIESPVPAGVRPGRGSYGGKAKVAGI